MIGFTYLILTWYFSSSKAKGMEGCPTQNTEVFKVCNADLKLPTKHLIADFLLLTVKSIYLHYINTYRIPILVMAIQFVA